MRFDKSGRIIRDSAQNTDSSKLGFIEKVQITLGWMVILFIAYVVIKSVFFDNSTNEETQVQSTGTSMIREAPTADASITNIQHSNVSPQYRHPVVQSQCQNYSISNTYRVNAQSLNVRKNLEGLTNTNIIGELKGGYICPIGRQKYSMPGSRSKWLKIQLTNGQTGFISSRYLYKTHCHYVGAINLIVRSSPNNSGTQKAIVSLGDTVCAINEANGNRQDGLTSKWYQIINNSNGQPTGWVNSAYLVDGRVNLTDNLPHENPLKELRRRIRQYNTSH